MNVACTISGAIMFGSTWRQDRRQARADRVRRFDEELFAQSQRERAHEADDARHSVP